MTTPLPTGTVTFLFTDIEGSTQRWEQPARGHGGGAGAPRRDPAHGHRVAWRARVQDGGRRLLRGFRRRPRRTAAAAAYRPRSSGAPRTGRPSAPTSPTCACAWASTPAPADARGGDYFGPALNRIARLMSAGHGGQVLALARRPAGRPRLPARGRHPPRPRRAPPEGPAPLRAHLPAGGPRPPGQPHAPHHRRAAQRRRPDRGGGAGRGRPGGSLPGGRRPKTLAGAAGRRCQRRRGHRHPHRRPGPRDRPAPARRTSPSTASAASRSGASRATGWTGASWR